MISIHPPREGWDIQIEFCEGGKTDISIHPPREGWDIFMELGLVSRAMRFQSTHPVRGGTLETNFYGANVYISIHPPREGWDCRIPIYGLRALCYFNPPTP